MSVFELLSLIFAIIAIIVSLISIFLNQKNNRYNEIKRFIDKIFFEDEIYGLINECSYGADISNISEPEKTADKLFSCLNYICSFSPSSFIGKRLRKEYAYILKIPTKSEKLKRWLCYFREVSKNQFPGDEFLYEHYINYLFKCGLLNENSAIFYAKMEENLRKNTCL